MQFSWPRAPKESVPGVRPEPNDTGKTSVDISELYRADQSSQVSAERTHSGITLRLRLDGNDKKYSRTSQRPEDGLRKRNLVWLVNRHHATRVNLLCFCSILSFLQSKLHCALLYQGQEKRAQKTLRPPMQAGCSRFAERFFQNLRYHRPIVPWNALFCHWSYFECSSSFAADRIVSPSLRVRDI